MKKIFLVALTSLLMIPFIGCQNSEPSSKAESSTETVTEAISEETEVTSETAESTNASSKDQLEFANYIDPTTAQGKTTLTLFGRSSFKIKTKSGFVIYVDPYYPGDYSEEADLVLVSHDHDDHNKVDLVNLKETGKIVKYSDLLKDGKYSTMDVEGISIQAVAALNDMHPEGTACGFVLKFDDISLYHAGDTSKIDQMADLKDLNLTYALLCCDGVYNMGPAEATECANIINAKYSIPIHTAPDDIYNYDNVKDFTPDSRLLIEDGKTIELLP